MSTRHSVYDNLVQFVKDDDSAALKFFLRWERDRRGYLHHRYSDGLTLLHQACLMGKRRVVHALVECGCDIEGCSSFGWTALHAAALSGCYDVVAYLVNTCASNVAAEDDMGCKPIDFTLDPQITALLDDKLEELTARAAQEKRTFLKIAQSVRQVDRKEDQISFYTQRKLFSRRYDHPTANCKTNLLMYTRCREGELGTTSQQSEHWASRKESYQDLKISKLKDDDSDRDSGIYEDFVDASDLTARDNALRISCQRKVNSIRGKSSIV